MTEAQRLLKIAEGLTGNEPESNIPGVIDNRAEEKQDANPIQKWDHLGAATKKKVGDDGTTTVVGYLNKKMVFAKKFSCEKHADDYVANWLDGLERQHVISGQDPGE